MKQLTIKRAYEEPQAADGFRVLVDRVWPRGVSKADLKLDEWAKELAPSTELRKWFDHDVSKWQEFTRTYRIELHEQDEAIAQLRDRLRSHKITLVYGAKDTEHNQAVVLKEVLEE